MNFEYAVKIMEQEDPTICPDCLITRKDNCENLVICNKDLTNFNQHNYDKSQCFMLKCFQAFEINNAIKNNLNEFKINDKEFKIEDNILKKKINNLWENIF
jgi:hypothetical protein